MYNSNVAWPRYDSSGSRRRRPSIHEAAVLHRRCERPSPWPVAVACSLRHHLARMLTECCEPSCFLYLAARGLLLIPSVSPFVPGISFSVFLVGVLGCSLLRYSCNAMSRNRNRHMLKWCPGPVSHCVCAVGSAAALAFRASVLPARPLLSTSSSLGHRAVDRWVRNAPQRHVCSSFWYHESSIQLLAVAFFVDGS
jgi:hypothetical protein